MILMPGIRFGSCHYYTYQPFAKMIYSRRFAMIVTCRLSWVPASSTSVSQ